MDNTEKSIHEAKCRIVESKFAIERLLKEWDSLLAQLRDRDNRYIIPSGRVYVARGAVNPNLDRIICERLDEISVEIANYQEIIADLENDVGSFSDSEEENRQSL